MAARGEAVGWTLLIIGVACTKLPVSWNQIPVHFLGSFHGMLFFAYIFVVLLTAPSLGWRGPQTLVAGLCSVPPYGTLLYEQWVAYRRNRQYMVWLSNSIRYMAIVDD